MSGEREKKDKPIEDGFTNSFWNILKPYTMGGKSIMGAASYIAIETAVGQLIRRIMKAPYNVGESAELHAYSVPFLGSGRTTRLIRKTLMLRSISWKN